MGRTRAQLCAAAGSVLLALGAPALGGCTSAGPDPGLTTRVGTSLAGVEVLLETHCGVRYLVVDGNWFERAGGLLDDGQGNPPAGWGNPYHAGRVVLLDGIAQFSDDAGHHETFHRLGVAPTIRCA
ncbi:hypothetical protein [Intrasporangium flavum]|uniref:hypothetical protein n=1 Tax=Intrasporangium flavum TaxID=1428657 RepID=UPI00096FDCBD|nr:hypothetical protein [Intrasporangium flavum]